MLLAWLTATKRGPPLFDHCFVINLARRTDRLERFYNGLPAEWPFPKPIRFTATDGQQTKPPPWFRGTSGEWGCWQSHLQLLKHCQENNLDNVLILEDDATFPANFAEQFRKWARRVPPTWQWQYLAGHHLDTDKIPPVESWPNCFRVQRASGTVAYAVRKPAIDKLIRVLSHRNPKGIHAVDMQYSRVHQRWELETICPRQWLVEHAGTDSDIRTAKEIPSKQRSWKPAPFMPRPVVAVLGPQRGGTSLTAGIIHKLGVSLGEQFRTTNNANPRGYYEHTPVQQFCRAAYWMPSLAPRGTFAERVAEFRRLMLARRDSAGMLGIKHPFLGLMVPEIEAACPNVRFVRVTRPAAESIRSLVKLGWCRRDGAEQMTHAVNARIAAAMVTRQHLRLTFRDVVNDPAGSVARIATYLAIEPTPEQTAAAIGHVDPSLWRNRA